MKTLRNVLFLFAGLTLFCTQCEKTPEDRFDLSSVPGVYTCNTYVQVPSDTLDGMTTWEYSRSIPASSPTSYSPTHKVNIQKGNGNQFILTFPAIDTLLPDELTVEITGFDERSWDEIQADIRVIENDFYKSTILIRGTNGYYNWFRYSESAVFPTVSFNLLLKSKTLDNIVLECSGRRYYN